MANQYNESNKYSADTSQTGVGSLQHNVDTSISLESTSPSSKITNSPTVKKITPYSVELSQTGKGTPTILYSIESSQTGKGTPSIIYSINTSQTGKGKPRIPYSIDTSQSSTGIISSIYSIDISQSSNGSPSQIMSNLDLNQSSNKLPAQIMTNIDTSQLGTALYPIRMTNPNLSQNSDGIPDPPYKNFITKGNFDITQFGTNQGPQIIGYTNTSQYDATTIILDDDGSKESRSSNLITAYKDLEREIDPLESGQNQLNNRLIEGASAFLGLGSILDGFAIRGTYDTLAFQDLKSHPELPPSETFQDFRQRLSPSSIRIDGTAAATRLSPTAAAYLASSLAPGGSYTVFNLQRHYGFPNYSSKTGKDFTQRSEVATVWNPLSGLNVTETLKNPTSILNTNTGAWTKTINPLETTKQFTGDKVTVIDFGKRSNSSIYKWKQNGLVSGLLDKVKVFGKSVTDQLKIGQTQDLVKFYFTGPKLFNGSSDVDDVLVFRAIINSMTDSFNANWNPVQFIGRADPSYTYQGFSRNFDLSFTVYASNRDELKPIYRKLNGLAGYTAPEYSDDTIVMKAPYLRMSIGDLLVQQPIAINSIFYTFVDSESTWEINIEDDPTNMQLPKKIDVNISGFLLTDYLPQKGGRFYTLAKEFDGEGQPKPGNNDWLSDSIPTNSTKISADDLSLRQLKKSFKKSNAFATGKEAKAAATEAFEGLSNL